MISSFISRLISMGFVSLLGLGVFAYFIWYFGPMLRFGDSAPLLPVLNRVILIVVLFLIWGLVRLFKAWRNRKKSAQISSDLSSAADSADPSEEQSEEERAELKGRFEEALKTLKKSQVGGKKLRSIYQLPWYIIIGPPGSGKTTLLVNSGLQFPLAESLGKSKIQGIGGTRYCDWWFTDEAVLIDTAGRYTTQDSNEKVDNAAWVGFLKLLKKHRRRRPINGIILAISMEELVRQSELERERSAKAISQRIQELYEQLGVRFPIYLMFTKCDLLAGFMEFFGDLDRNDREQVWGYTYGLNDDPLENFSTEYQLLQSQLEARLVQRLQDERDVQRRELIYNFPLQVSSTKDAVEEFLQRVFKTSRYKATPLLRGLYFTSGTQEGTPFNRIMSMLASNFSLSRSATQSTPSRGKSYFIKDLMLKVIFGESELAGANLKVERIYRYARKSGLALLIALPILINLLWWWSHSSNKSLINEVDLSTTQVEESIENVLGQDPSERSVLPLLNESRDMPLGYEASMSGSVSLSSRWGLYQGKRLGENGTVPAYHRILQRSFLPRIMVRMERNLRQNMNDPDKAYETLKAYLMLGNPDRMEPDFVREYLHKDWDATLSRVISADQLIELKEHLDALLDLAPLELPFDLDNNLVMTARGVLSRTTMAERIYAVIKSEYISEGQPFSIANMSGRDGARVFVRSSGLPINSGVPVFFSPAGYRNMYLPAETKAISRIQDEAWIFATEANDANRVSETTLVNGVRLAYLQDYTRNWIDFLEDVRILPFTGLSQAAQILGLVGSDPSPLQDLLVNVSNATRLAPEEVISGGSGERSLRDRIEEVFRSRVSDTETVDPAMVDRAFSSLHALTGGEEGRATPLDGLISDINNLYVYIDQLSRSSPDQLLSDMQSRAGSALTSVRQSGQRAPAPISQWILGVVSESDNLIAGDATSSIKAAWSSNVAPFCRQALNGRYPFVSDAEQEVLLQDFGRFFAPGGILDNYFNEYLFQVVDTTASTWRLKRGFENRFRIQNSSLAMIQRAKQIQQAFFAGAGTIPSVSFELRPVRLDPVTTTFMLNVNGQVTNYSHGPIFNETFDWPGDSGLSQVSFQFNPTPASGRSGDSVVGSWAWFRILDQTGLEPTSVPETFEVRFELEDRWAIYEIRANSAFNPFNLPALRTFRCPDQL